MISTTVVRCFPKSLWHNLTTVNRALILGHTHTPGASAPSSHLGFFRFLTGSPQLWVKSKSFQPAPLVVEGAKDAPVHPHVRPPRKLRQVSAAGGEPSEDAEQVDNDFQTHKPKKSWSRSAEGEDRRSVVSYSTAEEYQLEELKAHFQSWRTSDANHAKSRYQLADSFLTEELVEDAVHYKLLRHPQKPNDAVSESSNNQEHQGDVFIFSEGSVVFWNVPKDDANFMLNVLKTFEVKPYAPSLVQHEAEYLDYSYVNRPDAQAVDGEGVASHRNLSASQIAKLTSDGRILLHGSSKDSKQMSFVKYAFSDAIAMSVKLAIYESLLLQYVDSIEFVAEDMKTHGRIKLSKDDVIRKTGELFFLRHSINLGSNMLDSPDFYWDREDLESLYRLMCTYLNIGRRTKVMNEKLNHCYALVELLRDYLNNQHHVRLELMIIALICVEVFFEMLHYAERYYKSDDAHV